MQRYLRYLSTNGGKFVDRHRTSTHSYRLSVLECVGWSLVKQVIQWTDKVTQQPLIKFNEQWKEKLMETVAREDFSAMDMVSLLHEMRVSKESLVISHLRRTIECLSSKPTDNRCDYFIKLKLKLNKRLSKDPGHTVLVTGLNEVGLKRVDPRLLPAIQFVCSWNQTFADFRNTPLDVEALDSIATPSKASGGQTTTITTPNHQLWKSIGYTGVCVLPEVLRNLEVKQLRTHYQNTSTAPTNSSGDMENSTPETAPTNSSGGMESSTQEAVPTNSSGDIISKNSTGVESYSELWPHLRSGLQERLAFCLRSSEDTNSFVFFFKLMKKLEKEFVKFESQAVLEHLRCEVTLYNYVCNRLRAAVKVAIRPYLNQTLQVRSTTSDFECLLTQLLHSRQSFLLVPIIEVLMEEKMEKSLDEYLKDHTVRDECLRCIIEAISEDIVGCKGQKRRDAMESARHLRARLLYPQIVFDSQHPETLSDEYMRIIDKMHSVDFSSIEKGGYVDIFQMSLPKNFEWQPMWIKRLFISHLWKAVQTAALRHPHQWHSIFKAFKKEFRYEVGNSGTEIDSIMSSEADSWREFYGIPLV